MDITTWVRPIIELGFPVVVAVYLLLIQSKQLEKIGDRISALKIGIYLILAKLDAIDDYEKALKEVDATIARNKKEVSDG